MIAWLLSKLFPPRLPGKIRDWEERIEADKNEQGWAGNVQRHYRDGIERYFAENPDLSVGTSASCRESFAEFMVRHKMGII
jgi:hypothetical protein